MFSKLTQSAIDSRQSAGKKLRSLSETELASVAGSVACEMRLLVPGQGIVTELHGGYPPKH